MATLRPNSDFNAEEAARVLKDAMKGFGTDEGDIIAVLANHSNDQRQEIATTYKTAYGKDLVDDLKGELGGNFEDAVVAMMTAHPVYDARELHKAMKGAGTDEAALIEIMCSRNNDAMEQIKQVYTKEFESNLEDDLEGETSGYFKRLLVSQCNAARSEDDDADNDLAETDAQAIFEAGEAQWGTDEAEINLVLSLRSYPQLRATFAAYNRISERDIEEAIDSECSGNLKEGFLAIVKYAKDPPTFFAERLYKSMKGLGTDDSTLVRIIVSRAEWDLELIKDAFAAKYEGQSLQEFVESDCGGDYKRLLLALIRGN